MKKNAFLPIVMAVIAALAYFAALNVSRAKVAEDSQKVNVVVASRDLPERRALTEADMRVIAIPRMYKQKNAYEVGRDTNLGAIENLVTRIPIPQGNQLTTDALSSLSEKTGISLKVRPAMRGFVLNDVPSEVAALIKPDDKVDILVTFEGLMKTSGRSEKVTATILQNVRVLGVGTDFGQGMDASQFNRNREREADLSAFSNSTALSLELVPEDAQYLALAQENGEISVVVRNTNDIEKQGLDIATWSALFRS